MEISFSKPFFDRSLVLSREVGQSGFVLTDESWVLSPMYSPYSRIYFVLGGSGVLESDADALTLESGYVYLAPIGAKCGFHGTPSVEKLFFHVNLTLDGAEGDAFMSAHKIMRLPYSTERMKKLVESYLSDDTAGHLFVMSELYRTVYEFYKMTQQKSILPDADEQLLGEAMHYIRTHLRSNLTAKEVCEAVHSSRTKLHTVFTEGLHKSISGYMDELLMSEVQSLLMYTSLTVGQISERLGFCDQFYFSRWFKKHFFLSPKKVQRSKQENMHKM